MIDFSVGLKHQVECSHFEKHMFGVLHTHHTISSALVHCCARVWVLDAGTQSYPKGLD